MGKKKSLEEIRQLKHNWENDPCWDLETTEGFEAYKTKLLIYRLEREKKWLRERLEKKEDMRQTIKCFLGIDVIEERLNNLENEYLTPLCR